MAKTITLHYRAEFYIQFSRRRSFNLGLESGEWSTGENFRLLSQRNEKANRIWEKSNVLR